jgi:hypothetical protein
MLAKAASITCMRNLAILAAFSVLMEHGHASQMNLVG